MCPIRVEAPAGTCGLASPLFPGDEIVHDDTLISNWIKYMAAFETSYSFARENLQKAAAKQKSYYGIRAKVNSFEVGTFV